MTFQCSHCHQEFEPTPHQIRKSMYQCKQCRSAYDAQWRKKREALGLPVRGKHNPAAQQTYKKQYHQRPEVKKRFAEMMREYRKDPRLRPRHEARWKVHRALNSGKLVKQPCEVCGDKAQAHHDDYGHPLDVRWLCHQHHRVIHKLGEGK